MALNTDSFMLSGSINEFPLLEVIQFLGMSRKKGRLYVHLEERNKDLSLYFKDGELVHAMNGILKGLDAFFMTITLETGSFKFFPGEESQIQTIDSPLNSLLLHSQNRLDELKHLQEMLPPEESVLFIARHVEKIPPLNTGQWHIISMINGRRSLRQICEKTGDELGTKKALLELITSGLINTVTEDQIWKSFIPLVKASSDADSDRVYPPLLRTNLLMKSIDGEKTIYDLVKEMDLKEGEVLEDVKLLYDTNWITFSPVHERQFNRLRNDGSF